MSYVILYFSFNLTTVFWVFFRPRRALIVPNLVIGCQISYVFTVGRYVRVWGLKRPQKTSNVSILIFETVVRLRANIITLSHIIDYTLKK